MSCPDKICLNTYCKWNWTWMKGKTIISRGVCKAKIIKLDSEGKCVGGAKDRYKEFEK